MSDRAEIHPTIWRAIIDLLLLDNSTPLNGKYWTRRAVAIQQALYAAGEERSVGAINTCVNKIIRDYDEDGIRQLISHRIDPRLPGNQCVISELDPDREFTRYDKAFAKARWDQAKKECKSHELWSERPLVASLAIMLNVKRSRVRTLLAELKAKGRVRTPQPPVMNRIRGT